MAPTALMESPITVTDTAPPPRALLSVRGMDVHYPKTHAPAIVQADLEVFEHDRIAIVGPSGGGKTTLLRALEGSVAPAAGSINRSGRVALVYQDLRLVKEQTVLDNVCSGAFAEMGSFQGIFNFPMPIVERARTLLADLGLARLETRKVGSLSGGQRQRTAIARALCARPAVLLADEPLAALDPQNARRILDLLASLQSKYNFALVMSIHDPASAVYFFRRYLFIKDGRVEELSRKVFTHGGGGLVQPRGGVFGPKDKHNIDDEEAAGESMPAGQGGGEADAINAPAQDRAVVAASPFARVARRVLVAGVILMALVWSVRGLDMRGSTFSGALTEGLNFLRKIFPASMADFIALPWRALGLSLIETIQMAIIGTFLGVLLSVVPSILASRHTGPRHVRWPVRFSLNAVRTIPSIFWALIFVVIVGLGPVAGVLALALYSVGYLTKFFYEELEDVDERPASALRALGASRLQIFARAIYPAARPGLIGACLFVFEYNIRNASVLGVVGAGGIGQDLMYYIEWRNFPAAAAGLAMILVIVVALDSLSNWWRARLTRQRGV